MGGSSTASLVGFFLFCSVVTNHLTIDRQIYVTAFKNWDLHFWTYEPYSAVP